VKLNCCCSGGQNERISCATACLHLARTRIENQLRLVEKSRKGKDEMSSVLQGLLCCEQQPHGCGRQAQSGVYGHARGRRRGRAPPRARVPPLRASSISRSGSRQAAGPGLVLADHAPVNSTTPRGSWEAAPRVTAGRRTRTPCTARMRRGGER
jgi:hypothetical protein